MWVVVQVMPPPLLMGRQPRWRWRGSSGSARTLGVAVVVVVALVVVSLCFVIGSRRQTERRTLLGGAVLASGNNKLSY